MSLLVGVLTLILGGPGFIEDWESTLGRDFSPRGLIDFLTLDGDNIQAVTNIVVIVVGFLAISGLAVSGWMFFKNRTKVNGEPEVALSGGTPSGELRVTIGDFRFHNPRMFGFTTGAQARGYILEVNVQLDASLPMEISSAVLNLGSGVFTPMLYPGDVGTVQGAVRTLIGEIRGHAVADLVFHIGQSQPPGECQAQLAVQADGKQWNSEPITIRTP